MPGKKIKAILFDLGETLLNFGRVNTTEIFRQSAKATYEFLRSCKQPLGSFTWYFLHSMTAFRFRCLVSMLTGKDFDTILLLKTIGTKKGLTLSEDQWRQLGWLWYEPLAKQARIEPKLKETLSCLKQMGLKLGIVSNTFISEGSLDRHLAQFGILDFFTLRIYSYQVAFRKPDIRIFQTAAQQIGEPPGNILFVGDRINKDVSPALRAGMQAVLKEAYTNIGKTIPEGVLKISRLAELPKLIEKINGNCPAAVRAENDGPRNTINNKTQKEFCV
ncbi:MAG: HAD family hydrolase [Phycisphaerae bacterium]|nr:HAD family hydrolase [Phycisphaerae bacterium]MDD5380181.1 HAD family hydrolase [Phycisphaerae bacterium]